ncbi:MAG: hypothetical protein NTY48_07240 [Candidatus Diapherotrites archaeon]|nr:hypothetical protein [Candidatus Diapherotrites archaeon]
MLFSGCTQAPICGDGTCNESEDASTCSIDCVLGTTSGVSGNAQSMPVAGAPGPGTGGRIACGSVGNLKYNPSTQTCCIVSSSGRGSVGPKSYKCCGSSGK